MIASINSERPALAARSSRATLLKQIRQLHLYLGVFFAPAILFFSLTGAVQLFGLHEGHPGEAYQPPKWIAALASIHKDQVLSQHHGPPPGAADQPAEALPPSGMRKSPGEPRGPRGGEEQQEAKATLVLVLPRHGAWIGDHYSARYLHGFQIQSEPHHCLGPVDCRRRHTHGAYCFVGLVGRYSAASIDCNMRI
jgi:hypothetical protein